MMACWLVKTEPGDYSFSDMEREKRVVWSGVKNAAAQLNLRAMKAGESVLIYHTGDEKAVVGTGKVARGAFADPTDALGKRVAVELVVGERLPKPVTLAEIKGDGRFKEWGLVKIGRLSVVPTEKEVFGWVVKKGQGSGVGDSGAPRGGPGGEPAPCQAGLGEGWGASGGGGRGPCCVCRPGP
jgi:predicted RNA-binding protein with PUA-like domain